jgi:hypothetical protein
MTRTLPLLGTIALLGVGAAAVGCSPEDGDSTPTDGGGDRTGDGDAAGCTSAVPFCSSDGRNLLRCNPATGSAEILEACFPDRACRMGECVVTVCTPGESSCVSETRQRRCASDGSAFEELDCSGGMVCSTESGLCETPCRLRLFVLLDRSGSMSEGTPTKWDQAREALQTLMTGPAAADIEFGFGTFPTDGNCAIDGLIAYPVPSANASIVDSFFTSNSPNGNTPLGFAFEYLTTDTEANLLDSSYLNALLVVSDGVDTCYVDCMTHCAGSPTPFRCLMDCETEADALVTESLTNSTITLRDTRQIRTYVIGFGADVSDTQLSAIANNGGTMLDRWIPAGNVDDLTAALQTIIDEMWQCNPIVI